MTNTIIIRQTRKSEIGWINSKYNEINFTESNFNNKFIVIARIENQNVGVGRIVKVDKKNAELGGIYVFPNYRRNGVG